MERTFAATVTALASVPSRRVRRLCLRARSAEHARRAGILLADALHTASLPVAEQGRLVVIRRLALGRVDPRLSAVAMALQVERAARETVARAVPATEPAAATAEAVSFNDRAEAIILLTRQCARRVPANQWFWPLALPGWKPGQCLSESWLSLLDLAHREAFAAQTAAGVIAETLAAGAMEELAAALTPDRCTVWLHAAGFVAPAQCERRNEPLPFDDWSPAVTPGASSVLISVAGQWGIDDPRTVWLATMLALVNHPARAADATLPTRVHCWLAAEIFAPQFAETRESTLALDRFASAPTEVRGVLSQEVESPRATTAETASTKRPTEARGQPRGDRDQEAAGTFTQFAGLLFLIPVLNRLGLGQYLAEHISLLDSDFGSRWLLFCGAHVGMRPDDPLALALTHDLDRGTNVFQSDLAGEWLRQVRRWCRRNVRLGLHTLIRRPGRVLASRTQLDLCFTLEQLDTRIRRAGLDLDPGWVPWLGRIVRFHYLDSYDR